MPRVYIETYGCQMNVSDSELILGVLRRDGYVAAAEPAEAEVVLVNTCAVRDHAEQKVLSRMGELKRQHFLLRMVARSEEHTSELQSRGHLVCRLLPEKKHHRVCRQRLGCQPAAA